MTSATDEFDLLCIGSGSAGQRAAVQAAKLGKRVAIVEQRPIPGGRLCGAKPASEQELSGRRYGSSVEA
jgi:succinate dehydrogenase/fumarate reductase flavoprotein subunit